MPLQKQQVNVNFSRGVDTKTDPWQVPIGNFLDLQNSVFTKQGLLQKRNGYSQIGTMSFPATGTFGVTTFKGQLQALGNSIYSYNDTTQTFNAKGKYQQATLDNLSLIKNNFNQTQCDVARSTSGYLCVVYTENNAGTLSYKYAVLDEQTSQVIVNPTVLPTAGQTVSGSPRVFVLSSWFIIVYTSTGGGTTRLQYYAISTTSLTTSGPTSLSTNYSVAGSTGNLSFDGTVFGDTLYLFWNRGTSAGILGLYITASLSASSPIVIDVANAGTKIAATNDGIHLFVSYWNVVNGNGYVVGVDQNLNNVFAPAQFLTGAMGIVDLTIAPSVVSNGATVFFETSGLYGYTPYGLLAAPATDLVQKVDCNLSGSLGTSSVVLRGAGLASKAIRVGSDNYLCVSYQSQYQSGYYLIDGNSNILAKVAYQNGNGYLTTGLPQLTSYGSALSFPYLYKFQIQAVNKGTALPSGTPSNGVYAQVGINYASFDLFFGGINTSTNVEIGNNLNLDGGFLWSFDGQQNTENGFFVYPDYIGATWSAVGGNIVAKPDGATNTNAYWYQVTYEWQDNQGNIFRSAPSIPVPVTTTGAGNTGSITLNIPTLRLTYKTNVKIVIYRWSIAQQNYYQVTSITSPTLNNPAVDSISYVDTLPDTGATGILGNSLLYTTGGVLENISAPAMGSITLFDNRLFGVNSENPNELWYSKTVIQGTPVEMSDLLSIYVSPTIGAQGNTGPITGLFPMDDKLIIFKKNAIYYINGSGPDNTGANSNYSEPIFITGTVGTTNQNSIVAMTQGLMFQSDKGIWLLTRDLQTAYIGAPVESYTQGAFVSSALAIPGTNQVRFSLIKGPPTTILVYDYFFQQWGTFTGNPYSTSTLYNSLQTTHNYLTGKITQETPGSYKDLSNPVLMSFKTSWLAIAGILGFQRAYFMFLLGKYKSPHKLNIGLAYDFNPAITQQVVITPNNYNNTYGEDPYFGTTSPWGGNESVERWRIMFQRQKCDSIQLTMSEMFDPSFGTDAGEGLTLSGMNFIIGVKRVFNTIPASLTAG